MSLVLRSPVRCGCTATPVDQSRTNSTRCRLAAIASAKDTSSSHRAQAKGKVAGSIVTSPQCGAHCSNGCCGTIPVRLAGPIRKISRSRAKTKAAGEERGMPAQMPSTTNAKDWSLHGATTARLMTMSHGRGLRPKRRRGRQPRAGERATPPVAIPSRERPQVGDAH